MVDGSSSAAAEPRSVRRSEGAIEGLMTVQLVVNSSAATATTSSSTWRKVNRAAAGSSDGAVFIVKW
jgi:hypothetical protein